MYYNARQRCGVKYLQGILCNPITDIRITDHVPIHFVSLPFSD